MRVLIFDESFRRALKRRCKNRPQLQAKVLATLSLLEIDPFTPALKTHKLQGELKDLWSCSVEYDFRIVFYFQQLEEEEEEAIALVDVGTHDEVY
ncbi:MAG: type II toxin-antitoxin system mRNA interferase toxin, RelE/StbE family [Leptolyngbyaceae cyanobacterium RM2_2_4]|nr:type II toxin-antitoxin system mRNA interferase toxin, RelE/StbE family [Leptolyngbyaceae cyanobacterium SM1_4_3]NJN91172.1 type II toxin-antitoxin system mRNA interferase toxin, RelE/StbE family [Leptolyngbyaceae cyanobacterium SL_5_14]NJO51245.1 type II toxin-antitoxin system mRNA interferase toxin, RelE/StbE family [Leptolyngbyaceae cyanobacterium RM2_2_4]NJO75607.1 type II toxin-antitoxin system mRNA interferase toxin, RelE/StbE family [Leptolyngbyaceae cyanobacterium RM1_406_9]